MRFSLFPRTVKFFDLFRRQIAKASEAAALLEEVFADTAGSHDKCERINTVESEGDLLFREIARELSLTFLTPIDKEDIHEINVVQEDVLNLIKAISTRIGLYGFAAAKEAAKELAGLLKSMVSETALMMERLEAKDEVEEHIGKVSKWKHEADMLLLVGLGELYEGKIGDPEVVLDVLKWTQIYDRIEHAIHRAEYLAFVIEGVALTNA